MYSMNGVSEPEQLKCGVEAFHGIDKDMDGLWFYTIWNRLLSIMNTQLALDFFSSYVFTC